MNYIFLKWFQDFTTGASDAINWLVSKPFANVAGLPNEIKVLTPLMLVGFGGLLVFIIVAVVKWVIS